MPLDRALGSGLLNSASLDRMRPVVRVTLSVLPGGGKLGRRTHPVGGTAAWAEGKLSTGIHLAP